MYVWAVDVSDAHTVFPLQCAPYVRVYIVEDTCSHHGYPGTFDRVHDGVMLSAHILRRGHGMSDSDDERVAISSLQSNEVVAGVTSTVEIDLEPNGVRRTL